MPEKTATPIARRISAPAPVLVTSGKTPAMKASDVERGLGDAGAFLAALDRELDDQDRVLGREADEHDQADLREDVVLALREPQADERGEQRHRDDEDDGERQAEAFVLRREHEEHQEDAKRVDPETGVARDDLLERELGPLERHTLRQRLG